MSPNIYTSLFLLLLSLPAFPQQVVPGHAHNDYAVNTPLTEALSLGMMSIEADVHLLSGELYVAHDPPDTSHTPTLRELYLQPLQQIIQQQGGEVYPGYQGPFLLMIDFKTDSTATWQVLRQQLQAYHSMLQTPSNPGPVRLLVSGNRPVALLKQTQHRLAGLDGRPEELGKGYSAQLMPVVSQHYLKVASWDGKGNIPAKDLQAIRALADRVHAEGKLLRLWAIPDHPRAWEALLQAGVDLINTDLIEDFRRYYLQRRSQQKR